MGKTLMMELGVYPRQLKARQDVDSDLSDLAAGNKLSFHNFVHLIVKFRTIFLDSCTEHLNKMFDVADADKSGTLDSCEICTLLEMLDLTPHTKEEQDNVKEFFLAQDHDGNGNIDKEGFQTIFLRMGEQQRRETYMSRRSSGLEWGLCDAEIQEIMQAFDAFDDNGIGEMPLPQARNAMVTICQNMTHDQVAAIFDKCIEDPRAVTFEEFLSATAPVLSKACKGVVTTDEESVPAAEEPTAHANAQSRTCRQLLRSMRLPKHYVLSLEDDELLAVLCNYLGVEFNPREDLNKLMERLNLASVPDFLVRAFSYGNLLDQEASSTLTANKEGILPDVTFPPKFSFTEVCFAGTQTITFSKNASIQSYA